ncbi:phosphate ABC transporter permease subunit PstC [Bacteroides sp. 51]|nr:phosphate ABC transporter permease subunit PstC [Bacteroides sp. 51]NDV84248.1 phosphate ABC transporter permease subunit PstC [Bacteroides sp. 51]
MKFIKKVLTVMMEKLLMISGFATSLIILLIVIFLFKEGAGLFSSPDVEEGYVLAVNKENRVAKLSPNDILNIFDAEIVNWKAVGGPDADILVFRLSDLTNYVSEEELGADLENIPQCLSKVVAEHPHIIAYFPEQYVSEDFGGRILDKGRITPAQFFIGKQWYPTSQPSPLYGLLPLLLGTLWVSLGAILIALPFGLAVAIYLAELADERLRKILKPIIELLAGIPSVVYGFFGLVVIVPMIQKIFSLPVGETGLAGSIILAIMALPTIITVAEDAIRSTPRVMKESSLALGATHWQTIRKVVIPYSISGITAAAVLGIGRAIGETMAVLMVTGNAAVMPTTLLEPVRTIPATIAAELGEAPAGGTHYEALFLLGCVLFLLTLIISITVEVISSRNRKQSI